LRLQFFSGTIRIVSRSPPPRRFGQPSRLSRVCVRTARRRLLLCPVVLFVIIYLKNVGFIAPVTLRTTPDASKTIEFAY